MPGPPLLVIIESHAREVKRAIGLNIWLCPTDWLAYGVEHLERSPF